MITAAIREGMIYNNIGNIRHQMGEYEMAIIYYDESLEIISSLGGDESFEYVKAFMNKGISLNRLGKSDEAIHAYNQCLNNFLSSK